MRLSEVIHSHDNNFTLIRIILASGVIYFHSFEMTGASGFYDYITLFLLPITSAGGFAVQSFFFLSGLFVAQSFARNPNVITYAIRRVMRIWPALIGCVIITSLLAIIFFSPYSLGDYLSYHYFYRFLLKNIFLIYEWELFGIFQDNRQKALNGAIHTLAPEVKLYFLLGLLGLVGAFKNPKYIFIAALSFLVACMFDAFLDTFSFLFNMNYTLYAASMFVGGVLVYSVADKISIQLWQGAVLAILLVVKDPGTVNTILFYSFTAWGLLYLGQLKFIWKLKKIKLDLSYGIYLYGWPCQQFIAELFPIINPYLMTAIAILFAALFAAFSWEYIEKPNIKVGKWLVSLVNNRLSEKIHSPLNGFLPTAMMVIVMVFILVMDKFTLYQDLKPVLPMGIKITNFGPQISPVGIPINQQTNGNSAIWVNVDLPLAAKSTIVIDGWRLDTQVVEGSNVVTAKIPDHILETIGKKDIFIELKGIEDTKRTNVATFEITN